MTNTCCIILGTVVAIIALVILYKKVISKEGYNEVLLSPQLNDYMVQRPTFKGELSPRFDPYRTGGGYIKSSYPPMNAQGAGVTPLSDNEMIMSGTGSAITSAQDSDFASIATEKENIKDYQKACGSISEDVVSEFKKAQGYTDPSQLLPIPDIRSCVKDPSDPENYMYDRTLFAPLKRRHGNIPVDFIRGDLYIEPIRTGWFDTPSIPSVDLQKGAVSIISGPTLDSEDALWSRGEAIVPQSVEKQMEKADAVLPWGSSPYHFQ